MITPIGNKLVMKRQQWQPSFTIDFKSIEKRITPTVKIAQKMDPQPPSVKVQHIDANEASNLQGLETQGTDNMQQNKNTQNGGENNQNDSQEMVVDKQKIENVERALISKIRKKQVNARLEISSDNQSLVVRFSTSPQIVDLKTGKPIPADEAFSDVIIWARNIGMTVDYPTNGHSSETRQIGKHRMKEKANFVFKYRIPERQEEDVNEVTTINGTPHEGSSQQQQHGDPNDFYGAQTLPEILASRRFDLSKKIAKIIGVTKK